MPRGRQNRLPRAAFLIGLLLEPRSSTCAGVLMDCSGLASLAPVVPENVIRSAYAVTPGRRRCHPGSPPPASPSPTPALGGYLLLQSRCSCSDPRPRNVVMRRLGDPGHRPRGARRAKVAIISLTCDRGAAPLAGLAPWAILICSTLGVDQVLRGHAEVARKHLPGSLDSCARCDNAPRILAPLAGGGAPPSLGFHGNAPAASCASG